VRIVSNDRGSKFYRCGKGGKERGFMKYPPQPVLACPGYSLENCTMSSNHSAIKNLIIDLGGVLYAIDYAIIEHGMKSLQDPKDTNVIRYSKSYQDELFTLFEIGSITPQAFYEGMKEKFHLQASQEAFEAVWNSMLLGLINGRLELIKDLANHYRLFLLSNTNLVHYTYLLPECEAMFHAFEKCYLSFEMGLRKPSAEIFQTVLKENQLLPEETLFIEDSPQHITTAQSLGIHTLYVTDDAWPDQLKHLLT
jgi:putative hydrolase of the HAD superfamily